MAIQYSTLSPTRVSETDRLSCSFSSPTSITIPNSVTSIGIFAFSGCTGLTSITIPGNVTIIDNMTFYNCTGLTSITIPGSVTKIVCSAFSNCTSLKDVYYEGRDITDITIEEGNECLTDALWHYNHSTSVFDTVISSVSNFFTTIGNTISSIFASIVDFFKNLF